MSGRRGPAGRTVLRLVGLALTAVSLWLVARSVDLAAVGAVLAGANVPLLAVVPAIVALGLVIRAARWRVVLHGGGIAAPLGLGRVLPVLLVGYLGNTVLPARLGEPIRAFLLARREGLAGTRTLGSVVLERVIDVTTLALVGLAAAIAVGAAGWLVQLTALAAGVGVAVLVVLGTGAGRLVAAARGRLGRRRRLEPWLARAERFALGSGAVHSAAAIGAAAAISLGAWLLDGLSMWVVAAALGIQLGPPAAMLVAAVAILGTAVPAAPGFVGTYDLAAASAAQALGVPPDQALALALGAHVLTILPPAIGGALSLAVLGERLSSLAGAAGASTDDGGTGPDGRPATASRP